MKLSDIEGFQKRGIFFVKFTQPEFVDSIMNGQLYMNNIQYFSDLESSTKIKGQGDKYDGANVSKNIQVKLFDEENGEVVLETISPEVIYRSSAFKWTPIFCMTAFKSEDFIVISETLDSYVCKLNLTNDIKERMLSEFGSKAVVIDSNERFLDLLQNHFDSNEIEFMADLVDYVDFDVPSEQRTREYEQKNIKSIFTKDLFFAYQREYRIALYETYINEPITITLSEFENDMMFCVDTEYLFENYILEVSKDI